MNSITVAGQLGRDAEARTLPNGERVLSFSVADSQGREKPTIWWNCSLFGKRADSLAQYLIKGQSVTVSGNVTEREWTDTEGKKSKNQNIRVNDIALQGGKQSPRQEAPARQAAPKASSGFDDMDSDVPF